MPEIISHDQKAARNIKPIHGMLIYGPPGTGKSKLAKHFGELLGCSEENTKIINGTDVLSKWINEPEENIRKLFLKAEIDQKKYGNASKKHLLVIDEAEAIVGKRGEDGRSNTYVSQLLGKFGGTNPLDNMFVILITNEKESIDPAALRAGRAEFHLEIPMPNLAGRKEIFEIYLKTFKDNKLLDAIDLDELA